MISSIYFSENYLHSNHSLFYTEYTVILTFLFIAAILSIIIVLFSYILSVQKLETEKLSTYECGFEPYKNARHTFDIKFDLQMRLYRLLYAYRAHFFLCKLCFYLILIFFLVLKSIFVNLFIINEFALFNNFHDFDGNAMIGPKDLDSFTNEFINSRNDLFLAVDIDEYRRAHPTDNPLNPSFIRAVLEGNDLNLGDNSMRVFVFYPPENVDALSDGEVADHLFDTTRLTHTVPGRRPRMTLASKAPMIRQFDIESRDDLANIGFQHEATIVGQTGNPDALGCYAYSGNLLDIMDD